MSGFLDFIGQVLAYFEGDKLYVFGVHLKGTFGIKKMPNISVRAFNEKEARERINQFCIELLDEGKQFFDAFGVNSTIIELLKVKELSKEELKYIDDFLESSENGGEQFRLTTKIKL